MPTDVQQGLAPTRKRLDNGGARHRQGSRGVTPAVTICRVGAGRDRHRPAGRCPGVAHFLSRVIDRGTASQVGRRDRGTARRPRRLAGGGGHAARVHRLLHLPRRGLLARCSRWSPTSCGTRACPSDEIATRRGEIVTGIRQDQDNPAVVAVEEELALLYPGRPPVRPARRRARSRRVERIDRERAGRARTTTASRRRSWSSSASATSRRRAWWRRRTGSSATGAAIRRRPAWCPPPPPVDAPAAGRVPDDEQGAGRHRLRLHRHRAARPVLLRVLADEQRARAVRARRPPGRQHPRAAGDGLLRLQRVRAEHRAGAARDPRRRQSRRTSTARSRRSTRKCGGWRPTA